MPTRLIDKNQNEALFNADGSFNIRSSPASTAINDGFLNHTATTGATTLLTVAAGKTWVGEVGISVTGQKAGAASGNGSVRAVIATAGTGVAPSAGTIIACEAQVGANVAAGTVGTNNSNTQRIRTVVVAPSGNTVTLTLTSTVANVTTGSIDAYALGENF